MKPTTVQPYSEEELRSTSEKWLTNKKMVEREKLYKKLSAPYIQQMKPTTVNDYDKMTEKEKSEHHERVRKELIASGLVKPEEKK